MFSGDSGFTTASSAGNVEDQIVKNEIELPEMSEIDPQSDSRLTEALRYMAASSREGAPAQVAAGLATAFRRHHARRRLLRQVRVAALAACFVLAALLLMRMRPQPSKAANVGM